MSNFLIRFKRQFCTKEQLSNDAQVELIAKFQNGDKSAANALIESNGRLIYSRFLKYPLYGGRISLDDVFQYALEGMLISIKNFDINKNKVFSTYCITCMYRYVQLRVLESINFIAIPHNQLFKNIDISNEMSEIERCVLNANSLNFTDSIDDFYLSFNPTANIAEENDLAEQVKTALKKLNYREFKVIKMRFGIDCNEKTLKEISHAANSDRRLVGKSRSNALSSESIRQIQEGGIKKLKKNKVLKDLYFEVSGNRI